MLERVGLAGLAEARVDDLSGGERQRVGVARALVGGPELILADEPAGNLDDLNGRLVIDLLRNTSDNRGASVVLVTHDKAAAARADRRARLSHGRLEGGAAQ
jgi:ABC-type lipoprotein export system ATPase subunit